MFERKISEGHERFSVRTSDYEQKKANFEAASATSRSKKLDDLVEKNWRSGVPESTRGKERPEKVDENS